MKTGARCWLLLTLSAGLLTADGGAVLFRKSAGNFAVTLFGEPTPLRAGTADFSVMIQGGAGAPVLDAAVEIVVETRGEPDVSAVAQLGGAANKLFYAANLGIQSPGDHVIRIEVKEAGSTVSVSQPVSVQPARAPFFTYWMYFAAPPFLTLLFVLNQVLKSSRRRSR